MSEDISTTVQDFGDIGIRVERSLRRCVKIENAVVEQSERDVITGAATPVNVEDPGIIVVGTEDITITDSETLDNGGNNIRINAGDVRGQFTNSTAGNASNGSGVFTAGTDGQDETEIHNVESNANSEYGFSLGEDSIAITETTAESNGAGAYNFWATDRENDTKQY